MNQVQIRQIPVKSSVNTQQIVGSWFPSGYYGHFRGKSRADLCNHFRQLAQPNPPKKFISRQNSEATSHMFSQHDNRFKFENDPLVRGTQAGFGRRKAQGNLRGEFDPFFIGWLPENADRKKYVDNIKTTSYAKDYSNNLTSSQILSGIQPMNLSSLPDISVYSAVYNHGQPDNQQSKIIRQETFQRYSDTQARRSQLQRNDRSINVASCLVWNSTGSENETTKINDIMRKVVTPITLKSHNSFHDMSAVNHKKAYQSQSIPMFKTMQQPRSGATSSQEHYNDKVIPKSRSTSSFEQTHTNSIECLVSKYM